MTLAIVPWDSPLQHIQSPKKSPWSLFGKTGNDVTAPTDHLKFYISRKICVLDTMNVLQAYRNMGILRRISVYPNFYDQPFASYDVIVASNWKMAAKNGHLAISLAQKKFQKIILVCKFCLISSVTQ